MHSFFKFFIGYFLIVFFIALGFFALLSLEDPVKEERAYEYVLKTKEFMGAVDKLRRKGYFIAEHSRERTLCAVRLGMIPPSESYCKQKGSDISFLDNWPEEEEQIHKNMRAEVDSLLVTKWNGWLDE